MSILTSRHPRVVSSSLPKELLARIDARAASLGMPRSRYLAVLARADVDRGGKLTIEPEPAPGEVDSGVEIAKFLEIAVPALADYEVRRNNPQTEGSPPEPPEALAENQFWRDSLDEREEILKLKWIQSQKAGRDIGFKQAIQLWLKHRPGWRAAHSAASG